MVRGKTAKTFSLLTSLLMTALMFIPDSHIYGVYDSSSWHSAFIYQFFHANIFHLIINLWCFLSLVFNYNLSIGKMLAGYIISIFYGLFSQSLSPVIGLSTCIFAWMGMYSLVPKGMLARLKYHAYVAVWITFSWMLNIIFGRCMAVEAHIVCYMAGAIIGFINTPIKKS